MYQKTRKWSALDSDVQPLYTHHLNMQDSGEIGRDEVWRHTEDKQASRGDGCGLRKRSYSESGQQSM